MLCLSEHQSLTLRRENSQTWLLAGILVVLNAIDWVFFVVLDLGTESIAALSPGVVGSSLTTSNCPKADELAFLALYQRIVPSDRRPHCWVRHRRSRICSACPAIPVLFNDVYCKFSFSPLPIRQRFIYSPVQSAYPIAISVRSTNTYEDQAVGVQETEEEEEEIEETSRPSSAYILFHVRRQLAFDIWFLCGAVFILCIIERGRINSADWR
jgi:hypothetical protein